MKNVSIRAKVTIWFSAILIVVVALTYFVILSVSDRIIQKTIRDNLIQTVENNVDEIEFYSSINQSDPDDDTDYFIKYNSGYIEVDDDFLDNVNQIYTALYESDGTFIYGENVIAQATADMEFLDSEIQTVTVDGILYYIFDRQLEMEGLENMWLRGVVSETQGATELSAISRYSLILLPSLVLLAIIGGYLIARRALRPILQISNTAEQIRQGDDLKKRIVLKDGGDELHQLAEQFNEMFARLDSSFQSQQQFASDASHELRTPVSVILAQCELSLEEKQSEEEYKEALQIIQRQGRKMERLVNDMLDCTRLELQPERYVKEEVDMTSLVESICFDMALIQDKGITLTCEAETGVTCCGNYALLGRMLTNLISNAYRYGKQNGHINVFLKYEIQTAANHAGSTSLSEKKILLSVKDDGIGISAEDLPRIFDRFYQADASRHDTGSGLGLSMVKEIAAFHGGEVHVTSEPEQGSIFTVILLT